MAERKHLYNSGISKFSWFVRRFGFKQLIMKPLRTYFAPIIIPFLDNKKFIFDGSQLPMVYHRYNTTWSNERCVEVPIIIALVKKLSGKRVLEVGNVISHYYPTNWDILDKFEKGKEVINLDILDFKPQKKYDLIVSISTFEHIGYDDESSGDSAEKIIKCFENVVENCLARGGTMIMTAPIDYNPDMDKLIQENAFGFKKTIFMKRFGGRQWKEVSKEEAMKSSYGEPFPYANAIMVGFYANS